MAAQADLILHWRKCHLVGFVVPWFICKMRHFYTIHRGTKHSLNEYENKLQYGPRQANLVLIAYASSEGSGEPAHPRSLARTFAARSYKQ